MQRSVVVDVNRAFAGVKALVIDIDGVLKRGPGLLPGAVELLSALDEHAFPYRLLTNDPSIDRAAKIAQLRAVGLPVPHGRVLSSADPLGDYLLAMDPRPRRVFAVSCDDATEYLAPLGVTVDNDATADRIDAVIFFDDDDRWDMARITHVFNLLLDRPGLPWIVCNPDRVYPIGAGHFAPTTGAVVQWLVDLCALKDVAVAPTFLGKPFEPVFATALGELRRDDPTIAPSDLLLLGDTPAGDIVGANRAGWRSCLVLTGNHRIGRNRSDAVPSRTFDDLPSFLAEFGAWLLRRDDGEK